MSHPRTILLCLIALVAAVHDVRAQAASVEPSVIASGGDMIGGPFGEVLATIGQPIATDTVKLSSDELTWTGFWHIVPLDDGVGAVDIERMRGGSGGTAIEQVGPNPFADHLRVEFRIERGGRVEIDLLDVTGREVEHLVDEWREAGGYALSWHVDDLPSGTYLLRLRIDGHAVASQLVQHYR